MDARVLTIAVATLAAALGSALLGVTLTLASGAQRVTPTVLVESVPRPEVLSRAGSPGSAMGADPLVAEALEERARITGLVTRAAAYFEIPELVLNRDVARSRSGNAAQRGGSLESLPVEILGELNAPEDEESREQVARMVSFIGSDPRPFDSYLSRRVDLGVPARACYLAIQQRTFEAHLTSLGLEPRPAAVWTLALLGAARGNQEVLACLEEAQRMGPRRTGRAFGDLEPTLDLLANREFVLRAFLGEWQDVEAKERRRAFLSAVSELRAYLARGAHAR